MDGQTLIDPSSSLFCSARFDVSMQFSTNIILDNYLATGPEAKYYRWSLTAVALVQLIISNGLIRIMLLHGVDVLWYHCSCIDSMIVLRSSLGRGAKARAQWWDYYGCPALHCLALDFTSWAVWPTLAPGTAVSRYFLHVDRRGKSISIQFSRVIISLLKC